MLRTLLLCIAISAPVHAETLYKCVGKGGAVSYQSHPCDATQRVAKTHDYVPERAPTPEERRAAYQREQRGNVESDYLSRLAGTSRGLNSQATGTRVPMVRNVGVCEAAKAERARQLEILGLRRTYEILQRLDEMVRKACG